jgi:translation initiation factor IF-2
MTMRAMGPAVGPENANFVEAYRTFEDKPLTTRVLRSFGPEAPDTVFATNDPETNRKIMQNKKDYDLQKVMHSKLPIGPYYWKNPEGRWGEAWLADKNCNATYIPMKHCPFGGEYDPRQDNVKPHFEDKELTKQNAARNAILREHGADVGHEVDPPLEVRKLRIYFKTPNVFYDKVEDGEGQFHHVNPEDFRQCMYKAKSNRRAFLAQTQKLLQLKGPIKPPFFERAHEPSTMQQLMQAAGIDGARRSGRRRNLPNWFAGPKAIPTKRNSRGPTKRTLFKDKKDKPQKKRKKHKKDDKIPNSVLKADYKISRQEEDLKEAQFEALAGERELIKLGQNWRAAFNNNEEMGRDATARVFFSLPYRSELARDMFKLICGNCTRQHLQYAAEKFHAVALKSVREEYRATTAINLVSPAKKTKNKAVILYGKQGPKIEGKQGPKIDGKQGPKIDGKQGPKAAVSKGPEITVPKGPQASVSKGPKVVKPKGPQVAEQKGPKAAKQQGPKAGEQKGPKIAYHYASWCKSRKANKQTGPRITKQKGPKITVSMGPKATVPKGPKVAKRKGPKATVPKGPEVAKRKGPKATVPKGPEVTTPVPEFPVHRPHWIISTRAKSGYKGVMACKRNPSTPWRAKNSSGHTLALGPLP